MRTIRPGETLTVSRWIRAGNLKAWRQPQKERLLKVQANITRIVYGDGSVWERGPLRFPLRN
jgi:hypothetical protein